MTVRPACVAVAVVLALVLLHSPVLPPRGELLLAVIVAAGLAVAGVRRRAAWVASLLPAFCLALIPLSALFDARAWQDRGLAPDCEGQPLHVSGHTRGLARFFEAYDAGVWRVQLVVSDIRPARCRGPRHIQVYLPSPRLADAAVPDSPRSVLAEPFPPGTRLVFEGRLKRPRGHVNPAALDGERSFLVQGLHGVASARQFEVSAPGASPAARLGALRTELSAWVRAQAPPGVSALLAALAVGDQRFISDATWERLRRFGLTHLLVISGLHISLTALPGWWAGGLIARLLPVSEPVARGLPVLLALLPAVLYSLLAGLTLPTRRALLMLCCLSLPRLAGRSGRPVAVFAVAVGVLVLLDPLALLGPSFWLSVGAVGLLLWFTAWRPSGSGPMRVVPLQVYLAVTMLPISLFWFGSAAGPGGLLNLVAIPLVSFLTVPALLLAMVLRGMAADASTWLLGCAGASLAVMEHLMQWLEVPLARLEPPRFFEHPVALGLALGGGIALAWRPLPGRRVLAGLLAMPLVLAELARPRIPLEVIFFDVGQGTAVLLRSGTATLLYDTGPGPPAGPPVAARTVLPALRRGRIAGLDALVVSHSDHDHSAGQSLIRTTLAPRLVLLGAAGQASPSRCRSGREERLGDTLRFRVLSGSLPGDSDNNGSCVLLVEAGGFRFLLPGDIDAQRERDLVAYWRETLRAEVLLAAHHGSGASSSRLFLRHVAPEVVLVTRGYGNSFGHPARRVLEAVRDQGATLLDTARDGAVVLSIDRSGALRCRRLRHRLAPFWRRGEGPRDCSRV